MILYNKPLYVYHNSYKNGILISIYDFEVNGA